MTVVTTLEASVDPDRAGELVAGYRDLVAGPLPPGLLHTLLQHDTAGSSTWRIVTWWTREGLEAMRASGETPGGVRVFRAVGAEPTLTVWEVAHSAAPVRGDEPGGGSR